jgi:hypothetical protein
MLLIFDGLSIAFMSRVAQNRKILHVLKQMRRIENPDAWAWMRRLQYACFKAHCTRARVSFQLLENSSAKLNKPTSISLPVFKSDR